MGKNQSLAIVAVLGAILFGVAMRPVILATGEWVNESGNRRDASFSDGMPVQGAPEDLTLTVATQQSDIVDTEGKSLLGIQMPATITSTAFTWQCSLSSGGTLYDIEDETGAACAHAGVEANKFYSPAGGACALGVSACRYLGVNMGSAEGGSRTLIVHSK